MLTRPTVLVVEDNETDELLTMRALNLSDMQCPVSLARDGDQACDYLANTSEKVGLIILDLSLPKRNGFEVLEFLRSRSATRFTPVVVHSSSSLPDDIERALLLGANSYVSKAVDLELYQTNIKLALYYWLAVHHFDPSLAPCYTSISA